MRRVGYGHVNHAILLESEDGITPSYVLKVGKRATSKNPSDLIDLATTMAEDSQTVSSAFADRPEMAPQEHYFISETITSDVGACVVGVQEFKGGNLQDFFELSQEQIKQLYFNNPDFAADLEKLNAVLNMPESPLINSRRGLDFAGKKNLSIVDIDTNPRILIIDPHFHYFDESSPDQYLSSDTATRAQYIGSVMQSIENQTK